MKSSRIFKMREAWLAFFFLGIIMLNYPFLEIFNKEIYILDIPLPVLYLLLGWLVSIVVIYLFSRHFDFDSEPRQGEEQD